MLPPPTSHTRTVWMGLAEKATALREKIPTASKKKGNNRRLEIEGGEIVSPRVSHEALLFGPKNRAGVFWRDVFPNNPVEYIFLTKKKRKHTR